MRASKARDDFGCVYRHVDAPSEPVAAVDGDTPLNGTSRMPFFATAVMGLIDLHKTSQSHHNRCRLKTPN
jgi:hypothetical protein